MNPINWRHVPGLVEHLRANGHDVEFIDGQAHATDGAQALIDAYDPLPYAREQKLAALADLRWQKETGGFLFNGGIPIKTDEGSQLKITGARVAAEAAGPGWTVNWKISAGQFVTLTTTEIIAISDAVRAHVQACFDRENVLSSQILAAQMWEEIEAIDITVGWP